MRGKVKRVIRDKQFGFILGEDKQEYFFHASALKNESFDGLTEGATVEFEESQGAKGLRAEEIYVD